MHLGFWRERWKGPKIMQWLQASRTRANLVVKRRKTRKDSASFLCEDLCRRSCPRSPWQVLCRSCCARSLRKLSAQGDSRISPQKIFGRDLKVRSPFQFSKKKDLWETSLLSSTSLCTKSRKEVFWQDLSTIVQQFYRSSFGKISARGLLARYLNKLPMRGLLARFLYEISRFVRACAVEMHMNMSQ